MTHRFKSLRGYAKLPRDRANRDAKLTTKHMVAAIFGLTSSLPGWAGHAAIVLAKLRPVGGPSASFFESATLEQAIERVLLDNEALRSLIRLSMSVSEGGNNSHGYASLTYEIGGVRHRSFFVPEEAVSQVQPGAERAFDSEKPYAPVSKDLNFGRSFFREVVREIEISEAFHQEPAGDGSEYDAEEALQRRYERLGVRPGSRFLNVGVDNQVTWPREEMLIKFDQYRFVLMPKTRDHVQSIHVDLTANRLKDAEAMTLVNRFLSLMTWCDDQFAIAQGGWSGNPVPVPVLKRNLAFTTTYNWVFNRKLPASDEVRRALALYREPRNAQQNAMISYAVLNISRSSNSDSITARLQRIGFGRSSIQFH
jgi:hypothetical protein